MMSDYKSLHSLQLESRENNYTIDEITLIPVIIEILKSEELVCKAADIRGGQQPDGGADTSLDSGTHIDDDSSDDVLFSEVDDEELIEQLDREPKIRMYRAMQVIDGQLYPPMSAKVNGRLRAPMRLGVWEEADENPALADDKGRFRLYKGWRHLRGCKLQPLSAHLADDAQRPVCGGIGAS